MILAFSFVGCAGEHLDRTPPATITDLRAAFVEDTSFTLLWTAPGDDGREGQATAYDLRHSLDQAPVAWIEAAVADSLAPPEPAGMTEQHTLAGFTKGQVIFVALRTLDDLGNASEFSNTVRVQTGDPAPPGTVTDLSASDFLPHGMTLNFTAPGDDSTAGTAVRYEVRRSPEPITEATWESGDLLAVEALPRPGGSPENLRLVNLEAGSTAHYALRAVDDGGKAGGVSNSVEVSLPVDTVPPGTIQSLRVLTLEPYEAILLWNAPGNDGEESRVVGYEIRYSREYLTEETWETGTLVPEGPDPMEPGQLQRNEVGGLPRNTELWFGVRATDDAGNRGGLSNVIPGHILPHGNLWEVKEDGTGDAPFIQAAIDSSRDGDVVLVSPGTYYENLNLRGKIIELRSVSGPEVTTIDGSLGDTSVILCLSGETNATLIKGFTITGGSGYPFTASHRGGGGILCLDSCPTIEGNVIRNNSSIGESFDSRGGGITFGGPNPCRIIIRDNLIEENVAKSNGGGINIEGPCLIERNVLRRNRTLGGDGAGVYNINAEKDVHIMSNLFIENEAGDHGGGIYLGLRSASEVEISYNILIGNTTLSVHGLSDCSGGAIWLGEAGAVVRRNTIAFNTGAATELDVGGGICLNSTYQDVLIERNILFRNEGAVRSYGSARGTVRRNMIFENSPTDVRTSETSDVAFDENLFTDPPILPFDPGEPGGTLTDLSGTPQPLWGYRCSRNRVLWS